MLKMHHGDRSRADHNHLADMCIKNRRKVIQSEKFLFVTPFFFFSASGMSMLSKYAKLEIELIVLSCLVPESCDAPGFKWTF